MIGLLVKFILLVLLTIIANDLSTATPIKRGAVPLAYHVGHIVEHAYASETTDNQQTTKLNTFENLNRPELNPDRRLHHPAIEKPLMVPPQSPYRTQDRKTTAAPLAVTTTTSTTKPWQSEAPSNDEMRQTLLTNNDPAAFPTERSLAAFLAMLEETRDDPEAEAAAAASPETNRNRKREEPKTSRSVPPVWAVTAPGMPTRPTTTITSISGQEPDDWSVYDHLDTKEPNQTAAVMESEQKFGYVVNGNDHQRFRVEGKSSNGLITGLFGFHHNNGNIRGVQYTADPSINPKFLYDTLMKFLSS